MKRYLLTAAVLGLLAINVAPHQQASAGQWTLVAKAAVTDQAALRTIRHKPTSYADAMRIMGFNSPSPPGLEEPIGDMREWAIDANRDMMSSGKYPTSLEENNRPDRGNPADQQVRQYVYGSAEGGPHGPTPTPFLNRFPTDPAQAIKFADVIQSMGPRDLGLGVPWGGAREIGRAIKPT